MEKLVGQEKDKQIIYQLPSQANQTQIREIDLIYFHLKQSRIVRIRKHN